MSSPELCAKVVLMGAIATGKSSIANRYCHNKFVTDQPSTCGASFLKCCVPVPAQESSIIFTLSDSSGEERFSSVQPLYYRNAQCAWVVFDLSRPRTITTAKHWLKELARDNIPILFLVGNKSDLSHEHHEDAIRDAKNFAHENGCIYFQTSCKTGENISELFESSARLIYTHLRPSDDESSSVESSYSQSQLRNTIELSDDLLARQDQGNCCSSVGG